MTLRDTLTKIKDRQDQDYQFDLDKPTLVAEWKAATEQITHEIRGYLAEYESDGSMRISTERVEIQEESLGSYFVQALNIAVGPEVVMVRPVGRLIAGAVGRVDLHRQGYPGEDDRIMLLREGPERWSISQPPERGAPAAGRLRADVARRFVPLTKETLESAVDFLLRQRH